MAGALLALLGLAYVTAPGLLAQRLEASLGQISGLGFSNQSAHFEFSPPGLVIHEIRLANAQGQTMGEIEALHVPMGALWRGWAGTPLKFENATLHSYAADGREHFSASKLTGTSTLGADGSLVASGSGDLGLTHATGDLTLASLARAMNEGTPADFTLTSKLVRASYSGRFKIKDGFDLAGTVSLETPDAQAFLGGMGAKLPAMQQGWPLNMNAAVETRDGLLSFSNVEAQLGGMKALGNATYGWSSGRPRLTLDLGMDVIDLALFGLGNPAREGAWSEKPFDLAALDSLDAIWHVSSNALKIGSLELGAGAFDGSLKERILDVSYSAKDAQSFAGHVGLNGQGFQPELEVSLDAVNLDGKSALSSLAGFDWLTGLVSISTKLSTSGDSPAALVSKLSGSLNLKLKDGRIAGFDAPALLQAATEQPVDGWNGGFTASVAAEGTVNFADGIGTLDQASFEAPGVSLAIAGDIDILRQALELKLTPRSAAAKSSTSTAVTGPWESPKFLADKSP